MCCSIFGGNNNIRYIRGPRGFTGPMGPRGPIGPQGATGPIGPQGVSGTADIIYANSGEQTVGTGAVIPIAFSASTPKTTMSVSGNAVNLPSAGTYLVSYFADGSTNSGEISTSLYLNGVAIPNEIITQTNGANVSISGSKTALITTNGPATLSLYNTSTETANLTNASLTVLRSA